MELAHPRSLHPRRLRSAGAAACAARRGGTSRWSPRSRISCARPCARASCAWPDRAAGRDPFRRGVGSAPRRPGRAPGRRDRSLRLPRARARPPLRRPPSARPRRAGLGLPGFSPDRHADPRRILDHALALLPDRGRRPLSRRPDHHDRGRPAGLPARLALRGARRAGVGGPIAAARGADGLGRPLAVGVRTRSRPWPVPTSSRTRAIALLADQAEAARAWTPAARAPSTPISSVVSRRPRPRPGGRRRHARSATGRGGRWPSVCRGGTHSRRLPRARGSDAGGVQATEPVRRWLAARAFASWLALQGEGLRTTVLGLRLALAVLTAELHRGSAGAERGGEQAAPARGVPAGRPPPRPPRRPGGPGSPPEPVGAGIRAAAACVVGSRTPVPFQSP